MCHEQPPPDVLSEIIETKRREVDEAKTAVPLKTLKERIEELGRPRNFFAAVMDRHRQGRSRVIAEIKRRSPSAGWIRDEYRDDSSFDPVGIARRYHANGASAISCLTDSTYFGGRIEYIHAIRDAVDLPVLRKDFIIDPYQVWESRAAGADAILLIAECLTESMLVDLMILAHELQLTTLVETHDMENLLRVRPHVGFPARSYMLLGINNRDLRTMTTDLSHTLRMVDLVEDASVLVSESGIRTSDDLARLRAQGVNIVLVGESLMRQNDPGEALAELLGRRTS
ncbi:MAG: indole-3-glycerol phosphate synthase TrpC [Planctomycetota bacterium]|jgi:indole-3-glycerol phosphate synthase